MRRFAHGKGLGKGPDRSDGSSRREDGGVPSREAVRATDAGGALPLEAREPHHAPAAMVRRDGYLVGLTATDGCLITGRRAINFKSGDRQLVETYLQLLGRTNRVKSHSTSNGGIAYFTQFHDSALYEWFRSTGLTPGKSLTIGALSVPDEFLLPLARGLLDGDGSIINKVYRADTGRRDDYYWEYLVTRFTSGSRPHLEWLRARLASATGRVGTIDEMMTNQPRPNRHPFYELEYRKRSSLVLLPLLYPADAPWLA